MDQHNINSILDPAKAEDGEDEEGFDLEKAKELAGFVLRAGRRRRVLAIMTFLTVAGLGLTAAATMPKTYSAQVKILAQPSSGMRTLSGANQDLNRVDEPTKNVASLILRHDNLVALVKEANLVERFEDSRAPAFQLKDRIFTWLFGPTSEEDKMRIMVATLEKKLDIFADDTTLIITVDWPSAQTAFDLATLVQKNFLEARYDSDLAVINDSIAVLQEHAKIGDEKVHAALAEYQKAAAAAAPSAVLPSLLQASRGFAAPTSRPNGAASPTATVDPSIALELEEVRLKIRACQQERQSLLDSLKQQLSQAQLTLTPKHPNVVALQQRIDAMAQPSPELLRLKEQERGLVAQIPVAAPIASAPVAPQPPPVSGDQQRANAQGSSPPPLPSPAQLRPGVEDGPTRLAQSKLESAIQGYEASVANIDAANVELDIMRRAYKYRYTIISPAELPSKTKKPVAQVVAGASVLGGGLLAFLLAAIADVLGGQVLEPWQVRRRLKLEVLGEIDRMVS